LRVTSRGLGDVYKRQSDNHLSPLLEGRSEMNSQGTAFVCESKTCRLPVTDMESLNREIDLALSNRRGD
jgi:uncharacterized protein YyaL (SSP411 family)